jgi:hypothetical protein
MIYICIFSQFNTMKNFLCAYLLCFLTAFLFSDPASAQQEPGKSFADRMFFGGNLGLQFGNTTYIDVSPLVGYKVTEKFHAGIGATYIYESSKIRFTNSSIMRFETSHYGGRLFGRYYVWENLFAHAEYEYLNLGYPDPVYNNTTGQITDLEISRENINSIFVGGGYAQPIGSNVAFLIMALWNVNEGVNSPYVNPLFRLGIVAGF